MNNFVYVVMTLFYLRKIRSYPNDNVVL